MNRASGGASRPGNAGNRERRSRPKKRYGQHFLKDSSAAKKIVMAAAAGPEDLVIEIGPGRGAITAMLAATAGHVVGVEVDRSLCSELETAFAGNSRVSILNQDILDVDLPGLIASEGYNKAIVVGNLPYNITGPILQQLMRSRGCVSRSIIMVQREVARRLKATSGKEYGILTISVQLFSEVEALFTLPPRSFSPAPKVHSTVLQLAIRPTPLVDIQDETRFFQVVRAAFQQRRKMLKNSVSRLVEGADTTAEDVCRAAGVDPTLRPADITPAGFERIARAIVCAQSH